MWGDRELEEKSVYDHGKENGGVHLVDVPSMEQMDCDDVVAAAVAAAAAGGQPIYSGLHELTAGAASNNSASGASGTSGSSSMHQIDYRTGVEGGCLFPLWMSDSRVRFKKYISALEININHLLTACSPL